MSGVLIVRPQVPTAIATPASPGGGTAWLLTADPNEAWVAASTAEQQIQIDMGAAVTIDSFFVGHSNATAAATWTVYSASGMGTGLVSRHNGLFRAGDSLGPRHHGFARLPAPVTSRFFAIAIADGSGAPIFVGTMVLGLALEKYREFGGGRGLVDTGGRTDLPSGGFGTSDGVVKAQFGFSFVDLSEAEVQALWAIKLDRGLRKPVLVVEDADLAIGRNEAIHYGVFERFQAYERLDPANTRWAGSLLEWV